MTGKKQIQHNILIAPKFYPLFDASIYDRVDEIWAYGGRDTGKSAHLAIKQQFEAIDSIPMGRTGRIIAARSIQKNIRSSMLAELKRSFRRYPVLEPYFSIGENYLRTADNSVSFEFIGTNRNPTSIKGLQGVFMSAVDEADDMTDSAIDNLEPTVRNESGAATGTILYLFNPSTRNTALAKKFLARIDGACGRDADQNLYRSFVDFKRRILVIFGTYRDNPFLSTTSARRILREQRQMESDDFANIYCGRFINAARGAYYARRLEETYAAGRVLPLSHAPGVPTGIVWDLGMNDLTVAIVFQIVRGPNDDDTQIMIIDCLYGTGQKIGDYADMLIGRGYGGAKCYLPHDGDDLRGYTTTETAQSVLQSFNFSTVIIPNQGKRAAYKRIIRLRTDFPRLWFNSQAQGVKFLLESLSKYAPKMVNDHPTDTPDHTWSDACDAAGIIPYALELEAKYKQGKLDYAFGRGNGGGNSMAY